ncbi:MAG: ribonuclease P protein component [Thermodesulfobacteriota bacterium]
MSAYSFPKVERLLDRREFQQVFRQGKRYHSRNFIIVVKHHDEGTRRIGIITGKKVGKAHKRNRFKRLLREFYRLNKDLFPSSSNIVVIVRPFTPLLSFKEIECELKKLLNDRVAPTYALR